MHLPCSHSLQEGQSFDTAIPSTCTKSTGKCHDIGFHEAWQEPFKHLHGLLPLASFFTWTSNPQIDHALVCATGGHWCPKILRCTMLTPWQRVPQGVPLALCEHITNLAMDFGHRVTNIDRSGECNNIRLQNIIFKVLARQHMGYRIQLGGNSFPGEEPLRGSPMASCFTYKCSAQPAGTKNNGPTTNWNALKASWNLRHRDQSGPTCSNPRPFSHSADLA